MEQRKDRGRSNGATPREPGKSKGAKDPGKSNGVKADGVEEGRRRGDGEETGRGRQVDERMETWVDETWVDGWTVGRMDETTDTWEDALGVDGWTGDGRWVGWMVQGVCHRLTFLAIGKVTP